MCCYLPAAGFHNVLMVAKLHHVQLLLSQNGVCWGVFLISLTTNQNSAMQFAAPCYLPKFYM